MNRLASAALASAFFAAATGIALAADAPSNAPANSPADVAAAPTKSPGYQRAMRAAARLDKAGPNEARMTHALNLLEAKGYGDFRNFRQEGTNFDATVTRNGRPMTVTVEPDTNQVTLQG